MVGCGTSPANQWLARRPGAASLLLGRPVVEICPSGEGRGLGLFAISPVQAFSQILTDPPLILMQPEDDLPELYQHFLDLTKDRQNDFLTLSHSANVERDALLRSKIIRRGLDSTYGDYALVEMIRVANVTQTNAFNVDLKDGRGPCYRAVFPTIARINHSCAPNAHVCFHPPSAKDGSKGRMVVYTLRPLQAGEEVLISYFNILLSHSDRQEKARKWGFQCRCPVCSYDLPEVHGEGLRGMFQNFHSSQTEIMESSRITLREINSLVEFGEMLEKKALMQSAMFPALPDLYDAMAMLKAKVAVIQKNDVHREGIVAQLEQSALWEARITGTESPATTYRLTKLTQFAAKKDSAQSAVIDADTDNEYFVRWQDTI